MNLAMVTSTQWASPTVKRWPRISDRTEVAAVSLAVVVASLRVVASKAYESCDRLGSFVWNKNTEEPLPRRPPFLLAPAPSTQLTSRAHVYSYIYIYISVFIFILNLIEISNVERRSEKSQHLFL